MTPMDVIEATRSYERWMRTRTTVVEGHLRQKHEAMREDLFSFLRCTFYRWAQLWPSICRDLRAAPRVLGIGDLHVDSFGTWRDGEGRLCWGVDDFDEAHPVSYTNDLVRLAASAKIVIDDERLALKFKEACDAVLEGYRRTLREGGCPIVLAEQEVTLERLGVSALKPPEGFWQKLQALPSAHQPVTTDARQALERTLPSPRPEYRVVTRSAGLGSLGQQRFVAIAQWKGALIAREIKALVPSAYVWLKHSTRRGQSFYQRALDGAIRSSDPFQMIVGHWLIRRLSPDANPIEIADLPKKTDEATLLAAMGAEAANVHLGTRRQRDRILRDLRSRKPDWLRLSGKMMADATHKDWKAFRHAS